MTVLSIGMIVKNEEKRLRATLEALQPLRDAVDCQLIIADTGSDDGTIEIAKQFADVFLQMEWQNDFAKARNATLAQADGTWFFYLDADEVLTDADELIDFLNHRQRWRKYGALSIRISSLVSERRELWQDFSSERIFRRRPGQWFSGAIHERYPDQRPFYTLEKSYLRHYGYDNDDLVFMNQKGKRNLAIMEKYMQQDNLPEGSDGAKLWIDYAESLLLVDERIADVETAGRQALALLTPLDVTNVLRTLMMARAYSIMMRAAHGLKDYARCAEMAEEYMTVQPLRGAWDMDIRDLWGAALIFLEKHSEAVEQLTVYMQLAAEEKPREMIRIINFATEGLEERTRLLLAQSYDQLHDYDQAWSWLEQIEKSTVEGVNITDFKWRMALENDSARRIPLLYQELENEKRKDILANLSDVICKKDSLRRMDIAAGLRQIVSDDEEALLPFLALATNDAEELRDCLRRMDDNKFTTVQGGIIRQCLRLLVPMNELLPHLDKNSIKDYFLACQTYYDDWLNWAASYYDAFDVKDMSLSELWMARHLLCAGIAEETTDSNLRLAILPMTLRYVGEYLHQVYNPIMLTEQIDLLPAAEQFVIYTQCAEDALAQQNYTQAVQALREALRVYPSTQAVIERKLAEIEELADPIGAEMKRLAATVKQQIRSFIDDGLLNEAASLIDELSAIVPDDPDIPYLLEQTQPPDIIWN